MLFRNSILVTGLSILIVLITDRWRVCSLAVAGSRTSSLIYFGFVAGLMIPIRLATIDIVRMVDRVGLIDSVWGLIPVYVAMSLPIAVFVLTAFVNELPQELFEAARIDGAGDWAIYRKLVLPLLRPAIVDRGRVDRAADLERRVVSADPHPSADQQTLMLGVSRLFGQYTTDWTAILGILTLAALRSSALPAAQPALHPGVDVRSSKG